MTIELRVSPETVPLLIGAEDAPQISVAGSLGLQPALELVSVVKPKTEIALADTSYNTWTPSTTAKVILATTDLGTFTAANIDKYDYFVRIFGVFDIVYNSGTTQAKAQLLRVAFENWNSIARRPSTITNLRNGRRDTAVSESVTTSWVLHYTTSASASTIAYGQSYGLYPTNTAPTIASTTATSPTVTVKRPVLNARCSTTYFSTSFANKVNKTASKCIFKAEVYRAPAGYRRALVYDGIIDSFKNGL